MNTNTLQIQASASSRPKPYIKKQSRLFLTYHHSYHPVLALFERKLNIQEAAQRKGKEPVGTHRHLGVQFLLKGTVFSQAWTTFFSLLHV